MNLDTVLVWVWTTISVIGFLTCIWGLVDSYLDFRELHRKGRDGEYKGIVTITMRGAGSGLVLHGFFLFLGVLNLLNPVPTNRSDLATLLIRIGFVAVVGINSVTIFLNQLERVRLRGYFF